MLAVKGFIFYACIYVPFECGAHACVNNISNMCHFAVTLVISMTLGTMRHSISAASCNLA